MEATSIIQTNKMVKKQKIWLKPFQNSPIELLFGLLILSMISGFSLYAYNTWAQIHKSTVAELKFMDQLLSQTSHEIFHHHEAMLHILGERLQELNVEKAPEQGRSLIDHILHLNHGAAGFGLAKPNGQLILVSNVPANTALPNLLANPKTADSFRQALKTNRMVSGRTYYLPLLKNWVIPLRSAIRNPDNSVSLVMTSGFDLDSPITTWNALKPSPGFTLHLLRSDGYWQYVNPLAESKKISTYGQAANAGDLRMIKKHQLNKKPQSTLYINDSLAISSWLPELNMYTLVSRDTRSIASEYHKTMTLPALIFLVLIASSYIFYRIFMRQQRTYENTLIRQAQYDELTNLPNRLLMMDRLTHCLDIARRGEDKVALAFIDLDMFKRINDSFGHIVGDELLRLFAQRLSKILRVGDTVSRLGGDEFLIILPGISNTTAIEAVIQKIHQLSSRAIIINQREIYTTCSIGLSFYPDDGQTPLDLLKAADTALYKAKDKGRNTHCFYSEKMNQEAHRRMQLESSLHHALQNGELYLLYQPQIDLESSHICGCEALLRWNNPELGEISPLEFIPVAEETGQIKKIGEFVLEQACHDLQLLKKQWSETFRMAVNISSLQIRSPGLSDYINTLLNDYHLPSKALELEITENSIIEHGEHLYSLHALGMYIAIDDFGTGFSSLSYLQRFPISTLKIDRSFIKNIATSSSEANLVSGIINLGHSLKLDIVAEGIETKEQLDYLQQAGCNIGQGFYFSRPITFEALLSQLAQPYT